MLQKKNDLIDLVSTNIATDDYFHNRHLQELSFKLIVSGIIMLNILEDNVIKKDIFDEFLLYINEIETFIGKPINNLSEDSKLLLNLINYSININVQNKEKDRNLDFISCYGTLMYICAYAETILREFQLYLDKSKVIQIENIKLSQLLNENNSLLVEIFGKNHVKNLAYFFCTVGEKKIGENWRNSLAHLYGLKYNKVNVIMVSQMFYLLLDIVTTIYLYFIKKEANKETK